jgi:ribosome biogenesis protein UTP30
MSSQENSENVLEAIQAIAEKVPGKWNNIQAVHLKTNNSTSLPIYQVLPEEPQEEL